MPAHRTLYRISVTVFMASLVAVSLIGPNYKSPSSISTIAIIIFGSLMSVLSLFPSRLADIMQSPSSISVARKWSGVRGGEKRRLPRSVKMGSKLQIKSTSYLWFHCEFHSLKVLKLTQSTARIILTHEKTSSQIIINWEFFFFLQVVITASLDSVLFNLNGHLFTAHPSIHHLPK